MTDRAIIPLPSAPHGAIRKLSIMTLHPPRPSRVRAAAGALALVCLGLAASGCSRLDRVIAAPVVPDDYRARHPVVLTNAPQTLDIFLVGNTGQLDRRQATDVGAFVKDYQASGQGTITALLPHAAGQDAQAQATLASLRSALIHSGLKGYLNVGTYDVLNPGLASPVRLTFAKLEAKITTQCGDWPADLASGSSTAGWENRPYYNFGCAYQKNLTAQVNDPRDLVRPRTEDPADVQMRVRAIAKVRLGDDPTTSWNTVNSHIGNVGQ